MLHVKKAATLQKRPVIPKNHTNQQVRKTFTSDNLHNFSQNDNGNDNKDQQKNGDTCIFKRSRFRLAAPPEPKRRFGGISEPVRLSMRLQVRGTRFLKGWDNNR